MIRTMSKDQNHTPRPTGRRIYIRRNGSPENGYATRVVTSMKKADHRAPLTAPLPQSPATPANKAETEQRKQAPVDARSLFKKSGRFLKKTERTIQSTFKPEPVKEPVKNKDEEKPLPAPAKPNRINIKSLSQEEVYALACQFSCYRKMRHKKIMDLIGSSGLFDKTNYLHNTLE